MDRITGEWVEAHAELLERLSQIEPNIAFGTITIRKHRGRVAGLDSCRITREEFDVRPQKRDTDEKPI
ncbi:hypothetical protein ES703_69900 [subsurface metagenome]